MERLPDQHGRLIQASQGRKVVHGCDDRLRRAELQGAQDDPLRLLTLFQGSAGGEPCQAPDHHSQGRALQPPHRHPRVHVRRGGQCCSGPAAYLPAHGGAAEGEGAGRGTAEREERVGHRRAPSPPTLEIPVDLEPRS